MNDYWNDPPEEPEVPECCNEEMSVDNDGNCKCLTCGAIIKAAPDIEPPDDHEIICEECDEKYPCSCILPQEAYDCPHGNKYGECDACDHLSDLAYDAARENKIR